MGVNYGRRKNDKEMQINMIPQWMDRVLIVCKWFLCTMPFACCSIAMWVEGTTLSHSYVLTAVWCLSILKLIEYVDNK